MYPNNTHFPVLLGPSPTLLISPQKRRKTKTTTKRTNISNAICVAHIFSGAWSNSQWCEGFLGAFASCGALDCTLLGKIPVLFGHVVVRAGEAIPVTVLGDFGFVQLGSVGKVLRAPYLLHFPLCTSPVVCFRMGFQLTGLLLWRTIQTKKGS